MILFLSQYHSCLQPVSQNLNCPLFGIDDEVLHCDVKDDLEAVNDIQKDGPNLNKGNGLDFDPAWDNLLKPSKMGGGEIIWRLIIFDIINCDIMQEAVYLTNSKMRTIQSLPHAT